MSDILHLPYFNQVDQSIRYLDQYEYADINGLEINSPSGERFLLAEGIYVGKPDFSDVPKSGRRAMVLEPHCDDLALSASGYAMEAICSGGTCDSMNIFSKTAVDRFPWSDKVHITEEEFEGLRLQESQLAIEEFLGQNFKSLRMPLASKRGYGEIFASTHHDHELVRSIGDIVIGDIQVDGIDTLLCPMAIQGHIDHQVTFDVGIYAKRALEDQVELVIYEDYPYARNRVAYNKRLKEVRGEHELQAEYLPVDRFLESMADMAIIYRSQFDDINRDQMLAIMREDLRAVALEAKADGFVIDGECAQRYWRVI